MHRYHSVATVILGVLLALLVNERLVSAQSGDRVVFASDRDGNLEIYVMNADGSGPQRLTVADAQDIDPAWSPDKQQIAFASNRSGNFGIYVMNADGSNQHCITPNDNNYYSAPSWSPDGRQIALVSDRTSNLEIYAVDINGNNLRQLTNHPAEDNEPSWGPDGRIAFSSDRDGYFEIYVMNADGSNPRRLTTNTGSDNYSPAWSPDGRYIAFAAIAGGYSEIVIMDVNGSNLRSLVDIDEYFAGSTTWSPDGSSIAYELWKPGQQKSTIRTVGFDGNTARQLTNPDSEAKWPSWSSPRGSMPSQFSGSTTVSGQSTQCDGAPPSRLLIGGRARVTPGLPNRLRQTASLQGREIGTIPAGGVFDVLEGPVCSDGYNWWRVDYQGRTGWTVEGDANGYWLEPISDSSSSTGSSGTTTGNGASDALCGGVPQRFNVGDTVVVSRLGDDLRILIRVPGGAREAIEQAVTGDYLEIQDGPICARLSAYGQDTWYWYIYSYTDNVYGWVADGPVSERWICPTSDPGCDD